MFGHDQASLETAEAIVLDGANGVTGAPRAQFPHGPEMFGVAIVVAWGLWALQRRRLGRGAAIVMILAAVPGLFQVLHTRADSPSRRSEMAAAIQVTLSDLQTRVPWPKVRPRIVREEDDVLFPLGRYALPERLSTKLGPEELELLHGPLGKPCVQEGLRTVCGERQ